MKTCMNPLSSVCTFLTLLAAMPGFAQTCATPLPIAAGMPLNGNTCASTNQLPYVANGAIAFSGKQDIYLFTTANANLIQLQVQPEAGLDLALFVCRNQCTTYATCIATVDDRGVGVTESTQLPDGPGDYYVIVGTAASTLPTCGNYTLTVTGPLDQSK